MGNQRFQRHGSKTGPKTAEGPRHDNVGPMKTKKWPGLPGKTGSAFRNQGFPKKRQGAAEKGI